ncbi:MAG: hypothetical protein H5T86_12785, partial [Armatimonadetes bacterium]|nr:hypothetical protein [Armatimonadota bacterium]
MTFGLAKILWWQLKIGLQPAASFIAAPDCTITRNSARWLSGFGYGGKLFYDFPEPAVVLDVKPNACGMLVGGIEQLPSQEELTDRLARLLNSSATLDGVPLSWDFAAGNHFVDVFSVHPMKPHLQLPPFGFIVHSACPELRAESAAGPGLYWDKSQALLASAEEISTPWGPLRVLRGGKAQDYLDFFSYCADFAARKRLLAAEVLFGDFTVISNRFHQGLLPDGRVLLGSHHSLWPEPLPMTLRPDLPSYLMSGLPNVRAESLPAHAISGAADYAARCLGEANIVPHGGGYALDGIRKLVNVVDRGERRLFELEREATSTAELISDPGTLPTRYRGRQVLMKTIEHGLGEPIARLDPVLVIKA